ncbi:hypothetical protein ACH5RR_013630 [Cinchona calisaya]|uniref:Uncharacterized protein n=1 Tax=Cinchona calisaya TaxID=153742 RepID=A0ABD3A6C8_9GENT
MPPTENDGKDQSVVFHFFNVVAIVLALYLLAYDSSVVDVEGRATESLLIQNPKESAIFVEDANEVKHHCSIGEDHTTLLRQFAHLISGKNGTSRPIWNAVSQILMAAGYVVMAIAVPGSLYIGSILVGICYGARFAVTVPIASKLFGLKYYGLLYNILILNLPLVLSSSLALLLVICMMRRLLLALMAFETLVLDHIVIDLCSSQWPLLASLDFPWICCLL